MNRVVWIEKAGPSTTRPPDAPLRMTILKIVMLRSTNSGGIRRKND
jgi:hypothetical protein